LGQFVHYQNENVIIKIIHFGTGILTGELCSLKRVCSAVACTSPNVNEFYKKPVILVCWRDAACWRRAMSDTYGMPVVKSDIFVIIVAHLVTASCICS